MKRTFTVIQGSKLVQHSEPTVTEQRTVMSRVADKVRFNKQFTEEAERMARDEAQGDPWTYYRELNKRLSA